MKLENEFTVDAPVDEAWDVMLDLERVTPCLPGVQLTEQQEYNRKDRREERPEPRVALELMGQDNGDRKE